MLGEKLAVRHRRVLGRKGRNVVEVRVVGAASLAWAEAAILWGGHVEAVVDHHTTFKQLFSHHYPDIRIVNRHQAFNIPPYTQGHGMVLATITNFEEAKAVMALMTHWQPAAIAIMCHSQVSRADFKKWLPLDPVTYCGLKTTVCRHTKFGGVTTSTWRLCLASRERTIYL